MFVISNVVFLAAVFTRSTWLVIYARLLGILLAFFFVRLLVSVIVAGIVSL